MRKQILANGSHLKYRTYWRWSVPQQFYVPITYVCMCECVFYCLSLFAYKYVLYTVIVVIRCWLSWWFSTLQQKLKWNKPLHTHTWQKLWSRRMASCYQRRLIIVYQWLQSYLCRKHKPKLIGNYVAMLHLLFELAYFTHSSVLYEQPRKTTDSTLLYQWNLK